MSEEYLKDVIETSVLSIAKNKRPNKEIFTYDPRIEINGYKKEINDKISRALISHKISHSLKVYNSKFGTKYRIVIGGIFNIIKILEIIHIDKNIEKAKTFVDFLELRVEKLSKNKKARYGKEEETLYEQLKKINERFVYCETKRINFYNS